MTVTSKTNFAGDLISFIENKFLRNGQPCVVITVGTTGLTKDIQNNPKLVLNAVPQATGIGALADFVDKNAFCAIVLVSPGDALPLNVASIIVETVAESVIVILEPARGETARNAARNLQRPILIVECLEKVPSSSILS